MCSKQKERYSQLHKPSGEVTAAILWHKQEVYN